MNDNDIKLPPRPEPDGYLTIKIIGRDVEVNAYRDSTMDAYAREAVRMNASQAASAEYSQFLTDVMTAAGLVSHGKQCKALGERLGAAAMKYRLQAPAAQASGQEQYAEARAALAHGGEG